MKSQKEEKRVYVKNLNELARALKVTRQTIYTWRKLESSPKTEKGGLYCVDDWLEFQAKVRKKDMPQDELTKLKIEKIRLENTEKEIKIEERRGTLISREAVRTAWSTKIAHARSLMQSKLEMELPPLLVGLDAAAIQDEIQKAIHAVMMTLSGQSSDEKSLTP